MATEDPWDPLGSDCFGERNDIPCPGASSRVIDWDLSKPHPDQWLTCPLCNENALLLSSDGWCGNCDRAEVISFVHGPTVKRGSRSDFGIKLRHTSMVMEGHTVTADKIKMRLLPIKGRFPEIDVEFYGPPKRASFAADATGVIDQVRTKYDRMGDLKAERAKRMIDQRRNAVSVTKK